MNTQPLIDGTALLKTSSPLDSVTSASRSVIGRAHQHHLTINSDVAECNRVQNEILARAVDCGFTEHEVFGVHLALEEALVNAIKHGNGSDTSKKVFVDYSVSDCGVHLCITDEGLGFDPDQVADPTSPECIERPCGRGLLLIRHYMTGMRFNKRGNSLDMWKRRAV